MTGAVAGALTGPSSPAGIREPHCEQNLAVSSLTAPQAEHVARTATPHTRQDSSPAWSSARQLVHCMELPAPRIQPRC
jgi:hypothetical protein